MNIGFQIPGWRTLVERGEGGKHRKTVRGFCLSSNPKTNNADHLASLCYTFTNVRLYFYLMGMIRMPLNSATLDS